MQSFLKMPTDKLGDMNGNFTSLLENEPQNDGTFSLKM